MKYDLIILGGGIGGIFAAARAAELGVGRIAIFEKGGFLGGNGRLARTFVASAFKNYGCYDSEENDVKLFRRAMDQLLHTGNADIIRNYLFSAKRVVRWMEDMGLDQYWTDVDLTAGPFASDCSLNVEGKGKGTGREIRLGTVICDAVAKRCMDDPAVDVFLRTPGVRLLTDDKGDVCGAVVKRDGAEEEVYARKVILACGGVAGSHESLIRYMPMYMQPGDDMKLGGIPTCVGDGIAMAAGVGAETEKQMNIHILGPHYAGSQHSPMHETAEDPRGLVVNKNGQRIMDESYFAVLNKANTMKELARLSPGKVFYTIYGSGSFAEAWADRGNGTPVEQIPQLMKKDMDKNLFCIANDLEEAAAFIGCAPECLKATVERYEKDCAAKKDGHYCKDAEYMVPLGGAPYYIMYDVRNMDSTQGGITVNGRMEAVRPDGSAIGGMYVIGDHVTGFVSEFNYGPGGAGMTWAMVSGFLAAEYMAGECGELK